MEHCKPVSTSMEPGKKFYELFDDEEPVNIQEYQKIIGCLTYATTATRPNPVPAVGVLSKYTSRLEKEHWQGVKRILRYIQGTLDFGVIYKAKDITSSLTGYSDANWAGDLDTRRSASGYIFQIEGSRVV